MGRGHLPLAVAAGLGLGLLALSLLCVPNARPARVVDVFPRRQKRAGYFPVYYLDQSAEGVLRVVKSDPTAQKKQRACPL